MQTNEPNYMAGWGTSSQTKMTANNIDHIADKGAFAIDMINNALIGFDAIEKELLELSNSPIPPQPQTLRIISSRIDTNQRQVQDGLLRIKSLFMEIDKATDLLQSAKSNGWGY